MTEKEDTIAKIAFQMANQENQIIDDFCKAFLAHQSMEDVSVKEMFENYVLCTNPLGEGHRRHWWEKKNDRRNF